MLLAPCEVIVLIRYAVEVSNKYGCSTKPREAGVSDWPSRPTSVAPLGPCHPGRVAGGGIGEAFLESRRWINALPKGER